MNLNICTISFRHHLQSLDQLVHWSRANHFQGIELWGVHAKNLADNPDYNKNWLAGFGLYTSMISDYLQLSMTEEETYYKVQLLSRLAKHWGASKIRTFAGENASENTRPEEYQLLVDRFKNICRWLADHDLSLSVETHPNTYADTLTSSRRLLQDVDQSNLKINFDVLHVWESGEDVIHCLQELRPHINHFHLKNISSSAFLNVFSPPNIYSASGSREGIVPLFDGAFDYQQFFEYLLSPENADLLNMDASLEWFGNNCKNVLSRDRYLIQRQIQSRQISLKAKTGTPGPAHTNTAER